MSTGKVALSVCLLFTCLLPSSSHPDGRYRARDSNESTCEAYLVGSNTLSVVNAGRVTATTIHTGAWCQATGFVVSTVVTSVA